MTRAKQIVILLVALQVMPVWAVGGEPSTFALRANLLGVTTPSLLPYFAALASAHEALNPATTARIDSGPSVAVVERFCGGVGAEHPDVLLLPRRLSRNEVHRCAQAGVGPISEALLAHEVTILAASRDVPPFSLTAQQLYFALAAEVPVGGVFRANPLQRWDQIDPQLPAYPIRVLVPAPGEPGRERFEVLVMQAGCRYVGAIRAIYRADVRLARCVTLRADGAVLERPAADQTELIDTAGEGAIAVLSPNQLAAAGRRLAALPVAGVLPMAGSIRAGDYPLIRPLYLYAKLAHLDDRRGYRVAAGLETFLNHVGSEYVTEPGGELDRLGLVTGAPGQRAQQRLTDALLAPMQR